MRFTHYDLGYLNGGETVIVTLKGTEANVRLLDNTNFQYYRNGKNHNYYGGHYRQSPVHLTVPSAGYWNVTIDLGGYGGNVQSSVRVI